MKIGKEINVDVFKDDKKNPIALSKSAMIQAKERKNDVVIIDTAGRLHLDNKMMEEIEQIKYAVSPSEILYVADGMSGQDAVKSAIAFQQKISLTGTILTKMDGDSRGGAALSICSVTGLPIKYIGISEKLDGLQVFEPKRIADRILGFGDVISIVEKAKNVIDEKKAEEINKKIQTNKFDFEDFKMQIEQIKKIGPLSTIFDMIPGKIQKC